MPSVTYTFSANDWSRLRAAFVQTNDYKRMIALNPSLTDAQAVQQYVRDLLVNITKQQERQTAVATAVAAVPDPSSIVVTIS